MQIARWTVEDTPLVEETKSVGSVRMSAGKAAYEARRAAEAGLSLDAWLKKKARDATPEVPRRVEPARKGLISRLLDRAHRPL